VRVDHILVPGSAEGELLVLDEPVSFWGGVDSETGQLVDERHPQVGASVRQRIVVMPHSRGSSGTSSALTEILRVDHGPAGIVLRSADSMLTIGSLVAGRLYGAICPIVVAELPQSSSGRWRIHGQILEQSRV